MTATHLTKHLNERWAGVSAHICVALLAGLGVSAVSTVPATLHHLAERNTSAEASATNDFYRHLAGQEVALPDETSKLAQTIELWVADTPESQYEERLRELEIDPHADSLSGKSLNSELSIGTLGWGGEDDSHYGLEPSGVPAITKALTGDLDVVLLDEPAPGGSWFLPTWVYGLIMVLASSIAAGYAVRDSDARGRGMLPLNWSLTRATARNQLLAALLSPHVVGAGLLGGTLKRKLADRKVRTPLPAPDPELEQARLALKELLALSPRTASVEAAIKAVSGVVSGIEDQRHAEASLRSDRRAHDILDDVELLKVSSRARLDAQRELS